VDVPGLYVHVPFCFHKCHYCDFYSITRQTPQRMERFVDLLLAEADQWTTGRGPTCRPRTVFFGGGTPSLLPLPQMQTIVNALQDHYELAPDAEISLEANPGTVDAAHLEGLRRIGFNRISFGVQSFHDDELLSLDRIHAASEVDDAYAWARAAGFENVNLDLIYGLAGQDMAGWQENLEKALSMGPDHLSLYALTLEEGTPLTRDVGRGRTEGPDLDLQADMFEWSRERMAGAGYHQYEVSNWARDGRECRHNLIYWRNGDWLGLGAGAHSHLFVWRFADASSPSRYISLVNEAALGHFVEGKREETASTPLDAMRQVTVREAPDREREMSETVILALRLREGLDLAAFERRYGESVQQAFGAALDETVALGLTELEGGRLRLKDDAVMLGDEAFMRFLPGWNG
jgi:oxygen-independent coproporphyrinogen-3 oxidase